jgi:hypothetical protein
MHRPTDHDDSQAPASAMRSRRPSTVLEMFWSTEPTWISVLVGATQLHTFPLGQKRHDGGSQREISVDLVHQAARERVRVISADQVLRRTGEQNATIVPNT